MSTSPDPTVPLPRGAIRRAVSELRGTAPETRAVLAGLILVLGAWVGPGLAEGGMESAAPSPGLAAESGPGVAPAGGEAYGEAIRTASDEDDGRSADSQAADQD